MTETPTAVVQRMYDAVNGRDLGAIDEIFAPDFYSHAMRRHGTEQIHEAWSALIALFPGIRVVPREIITSDDRVAVWAAVQNAGDGGPATLMELIRVADGRIAEISGLTNLRWRDESGSAAKEDGAAKEDSTANEDSAAKEDGAAKEDSAAKEDGPAKGDSAAEEARKRPQ